MFFPEAAAQLSTQLLNPEPSSKINGASIDTRTLTPGNLFVALHGVKDDGHRFLATAFEKGAGGALVEESFIKKTPSLPASWKNLIPVPDTADAFLKLASNYRDSFSLKTVAVIGSVGKTSSKEFLAYLLKKKFQTVATEGNLNNHLGLPLTLFRIQKSHEVCVAELGTNHVGDIAQLTRVLKPDFGLLTKIAPEHLEGFGSMEQVYQGELELFESMKPGSYAVIPDDDPVLLKKIERFPLKWIKVGLDSKSDYRVSDVSASNGKVHFKVNQHSFSFPGMATFLACNAAKAIAMAELCGFKIQDIPQNWDDFKLPGGRFQSDQLANGAQVIFDGYNASPASFEAALQSFEEIRTDGRKFLVFSDMLELGELEKKFHEDLGTQIANLGIDYAVAYGTRAGWSIESLRRKNPEAAADHVANAQEAAERLRGQLQKGDWVLLKASRGMKIEEVLNHLGAGTQTAAH